MQLEQEVDLILEGTSVFTQAVDDWTTKWAPAVIEYGYTLTGKKATMVLTAQKTYEGVCDAYSAHPNICNIADVSLISGDDDKQQKVALYLLCHLLAKKGSEDTIVYLYEKCKVSIQYSVYVNY